MRSIVLHIQRKKGLFKFAYNDLRNIPRRTIGKRKAKKKGWKLQKKGDCDELRG